MKRCTVTLPEIVLPELTPAFVIYTIFYIPIEVEANVNKLPVVNTALFTLPKESVPLREALFVVAITTPEALPIVKLLKEITPDPVPAIVCWALPKKLIFPRRNALLVLLEMLP